jgi:hypothetical protein
MNRPTDHERLFADALADETPGGFRETLLGEMLRLTRTRRRWRQTRRGTSALVLLALLGMLVRFLLPQSPPAMPGEMAGCEIILTQPLPADALVTTQPFSPDRFIASAPGANIVQTTVAAGAYQEIGDDQLLTLAAPRPVLLVGCGPRCKQLIFVDPEDEKGFPVN